MAGKGKQKTAKRRSGITFDPEILYPYWSEAGGIVQEAMRLAKAAGEKRVPAKAHTWAKYAEEHKFRDRLQTEEKARWEQYHKEREERQQQVLDTVAFTFEQLAATFQRQVLDDFKVIQELEKTNPIRLLSEKRLMKLFGSMDAIDKFFRMYLRARELPERLTSTKVEHTGSIQTYNDLENKPKASSPEEARKMAEGE